MSAGRECTLHSLLATTNHYHYHHLHYIIAINANPFITYWFDLFIRRSCRREAVWDLKKNGMIRYPTITRRNEAWMYDVWMSTNNAYWQNPQFSLLVALHNSCKFSSLFLAEFSNLISDQIWSLILIDFSCKSTKWKNIPYFRNYRTLNLCQQLNWRIYSMQRWKASGWFRVFWNKKQSSEPRCSIVNCHGTKNLVWLIASTYFLQYE